MTDTGPGPTPGDRRAAALMKRYAVWSALGVAFGLAIGNVAVGICLGFSAYLISGGEPEVRE